MVIEEVCMDICAYIQLLGVDALHSNLHVGTLARGVVIVEY